MAKEKEIYATKIKHFDKFSITHASRMTNDYVDVLLKLASKMQYKLLYLQDHGSVGQRSLSARNSRR